MAGVLLIPSIIGASSLPVISTHPRLLLTPTITDRLIAKRNANDPAWLALKARADLLATYSIFPYKYATRSQEPDNTIFYDYRDQDGSTR